MEGTLLEKYGRLNTMTTKFILVALQSELIAQATMQSLSSDLIQLNIRHIVEQAEDILKTPIDLLYADIIDTLETYSLNNELLEDDIDLNNVTTKEEWLDMLVDLVKDIKEDLI